jgi:hypothetical protein
MLKQALEKVDHGKKLASAPKQTIKKFMEKENPDGIAPKKKSAPALTTIPNDSIPEMATILVHIKDGTSVVGATIDGTEAIISPIVENVTKQILGIPKEPQHNEPKLLLENV